MNIGSCHLLGTQASLLSRRMEKTGLSPFGLKPAASPSAPAGPQGIQILLTPPPHPPGSHIPVQAAGSAGCTVAGMIYMHAGLEQREAFLTCNCHGDGVLENQRTISPEKNGCSSLFCQEQG